MPATVSREMMRSWTQRRDVLMFGKVNQRGRCYGKAEDPMFVIHAEAIMKCEGGDCATCFYGPNGDGRKSVCERVRERIGEGT